MEKSSLTVLNTNPEGFPLRATFGVLIPKYEAHRGRGQLARFPFPWAGWPKTKISEQWLSPATQAPDTACSFLFKIVTFLRVTVPEIDIEEETATETITAGRLSPGCSTLFFVPALIACYSRLTLGGAALHLCGLSPCECIQFFSFSPLSIFFFPWSFFSDTIDLQRSFGLFDGGAQM